MSNENNPIDPEEVYCEPKDWLYDYLPSFLIWTSGIGFIFLVVINILRAIGV